VTNSAIISLPKKKEKKSKACLKCCKKKNVAFRGRVARLLEMHSERPQTQHPLHLASEKD